jgi:hypothetical protein
MTLAPTGGNGQYTVTVTNGSGCTGTSAVYNYSNVGLEEHAGAPITVYPNPVDGNGVIHLQASAALSGDVQLRLYDIAGTTSLLFLSPVLPEELHLTGVKPGLYFLDITAGETTVRNLRIVIL